MFKNDTFTDRLSVVIAHIIAISILTIVGYTINLIFNHHLSFGYMYKMAAILWIFLKGFDWLFVDPFKEGK